LFFFALLCQQVELSASAASSASLEQARAQYHKTLNQLNHIWDALESKRVRYSRSCSARSSCVRGLLQEEAEELIDTLTSKLDQEDAHATKLSHAFKAFKREIARDAVDSRTGKPLKVMVRSLESN